MSRPLLLAALFGSILLSALAQFLLKLGVSSPAVQGAIADPQAPASRVALEMALSPMVILGLGCFAASAGTWLLVLSRLELSTAYPFVALGIVLTVAAGYFLLGETMSGIKLAGVSLIIAGVTLLGFAAAASD